MVIQAAIGAMLWAGAGDSSEKQLEAAIHREIVVGDLRAAIEQYKIIAGQAGKSAIAARALFRIGECLEKLGHRKEARANYTRLLVEHRDQTEIVGAVKRKLAGWTDAAAGPRNLGFDEGEPGRMPPGWFVPSIQGASELAELRRQGCLSDGCVVILPPAGALKPLSNLMQSFSAAGFRGKTVRLRAWVRLDAASKEDRAQMWLRVDRASGQTGFLDNMDDRPLRSGQWTMSETATLIDEDAQFVDFGISSIGKGRVWVDDVSFDIVPQAEIDSAREAVAGVYARLDKSHAEDATFRTAITSFRVSGDGAVVTAASDFTMPSPHGRVSGVKTFRDFWARTADGWQLKERLLLRRRFSTPLTDALIAELIGSDLKQFAAPLATPKAGHQSYDLTPFGNAVGDARVVALGDATAGTREIFQMKHRLLEYLVKEKNFTVLALPSTPDTQEVLDVLRWIRAYNQSGTGRPALRLVPFDVSQLSSLPAGKVVFWASNRDLIDHRPRLGPEAYIVGVALHRGELRADGWTNGKSTGLGHHKIPGLTGTGDWVFSSAGMPLFFLDFRAVPPRTTLGLWLAEPHLYLSSTGSWNVDDPESHVEPQVLSKTYDGVIFIDEGHAAKDPPNVSNR